MKQIILGIAIGAGVASVGWHLKTYNTSGKLERCEAHYKTAMELGDIFLLIAKQASDEHKSCVDTLVRLHNKCQKSGKL